MRFRVKAVRVSEGVVETVLEAPTRADALGIARDRGMRVISVAAERTWLPRAGRGQPFALIAFTQQLATLLRAGLSLVDSIESLSGKQDRPEHRQVLDDVVRALQEGRPLSQALAGVPDAFPQLYVALVRASERTGEVGETLTRYASYQAQVDQLKKKIVSASIYPALLVVMGTAVMLFLLAYVVPKFARVYEDVGHDLPWLSRLLLDWGGFVAAHMGALALGAWAALVLAAAAWHAKGGVRGAWLALERLPGVRERAFVYQLGRLYRSLGMLLRGGIPVLAAVDMVQGLMRGGLRERLAQVGPRVAEGLALSRALEECGLVTPVALKMLRAGERSGNLGEMLERAADFYDDEMARWVDWFVRLFEPILMAVIGALIGLVVVLMYMPIFELASSIQ